MLLECSIYVLLKWTTACNFIHFIFTIIEAIECSIISLQLNQRPMLVQWEFSIGCHKHINNWILLVNIINPILCLSNVRVVYFNNCIFIFSFVTLDFLLMRSRLLLLFLWLSMLQFHSCYFNDCFSVFSYIMSLSLFDSRTPPFILGSKKEAINAKMLIPLGRLRLPDSRFSIPTIPEPPWPKCILNTWIISAEMLLLLI